VSDCCLTPNEQYEELDISKNSGKHYKNTNFDKEDILANHKSVMSSMNIPISGENCKLSTLYWIPQFQKNQYLDRYIPGSTTELGGPQSYCDKVYSRGNINQKHRIGAGMVKPKTIQLICIAFPLSTHHSGERAKTGWLGIRIMCPSGVTCLPADCFFSELAL
jgi:hypothetical protein